MPSWNRCSPRRSPRTRCWRWAKATTIRRSPSRRLPAEPPPAAGALGSDSDDRPLDYDFDAAALETDSYADVSAPSRRRRRLRFRPPRSLRDLALRAFARAAARRFRAGGDAGGDHRPAARRERLFDGAAGGHRRRQRRRARRGGAGAGAGPGPRPARGRRPRPGRMPGAAGARRRPLRPGDGADDRQSRAARQGPDGRPQADLRGRRRGPRRHGPRASGLRPQARLELFQRSGRRHRPRRLRPPDRARAMRSSSTARRCRGCWSTAAITRSFEPARRTSSRRRGSANAWRPPTGWSGRSTSGRGPSSRW